MSGVPEKADGPAATRPPMEVGASEFALLVGVHHNTVTNWARDGMPVRREGRQTLVDIAVGFQWVRARGLATLEAVRASADPEGAKTAKIVAEAKLKEMDVAEREGSLVSADDVEETWTHALVSLRESVMGLPGAAVQAGLIEPDQEEAMGDMCREALEALGKRLGEEE